MNSKQKKILASQSAFLVIVALAACSKNNPAAPAPIAATPVAKTEQNLSATATPAVSAEKLIASNGLKTRLIKTYETYNKLPGIPTRPQNDEPSPTEIARDAKLSALITAITEKDSGPKIFEKNVDVISRLRAKEVQEGHISAVDFTDEKIMEIAMLQTINGVLKSQNMRPFDETAIDLIAQLPSPDSASQPGFIKNTAGDVKTVVEGAATTASADARAVIKLEIERIKTDIAAAQVASNLVVAGTEIAAGAAANAVQNQVDQAKNDVVLAKALFNDFQLAYQRARQVSQYLATHSSSPAQSQ